MDTLAHICASALLAHVLYWKWVDHAVSLTYPMHTSGEANEWAEDTTGADAGYYEPAKGHLIAGVVCGLAVLAWVLVSPWGAVVVLGILSVALLCYIPKNKRTMKRRRDEQFKELERASLIGPLYQAAPLQRLENVTKRPIWIASPHFWDVRDYVQGDHNDAGEQQRAREVLSVKIKNLAKKDRKYWWRTDRAKDI